MRTPTLPVIFALAAAVAACGKVQESVAEKATEKMIESQLAKDGGSAKVDLAGGAMKVTTTDASGKTSQMEMGGAKVDEADVGAPFYPGAERDVAGSTRISTPDGSAVTVLLHSADTPDKVAAFYRERLKSQAQGKQFMDMSGGDGSATLMLADDKDQSAIQVHVGKADKGTDIQIVANRKAAK